MEIKEMVNFVLDTNLDNKVNIILDMLDAATAILRLINPQNNKTISFGMHKKYIFIDSYKGELMYDPTMEGLHLCLDELKKEIDYGYDIYGFNEDRKRIFYSYLYNESLSEEEMKQYCLNVIKNKNDIEYISISNYRGDRCLKFIVKNSELKPVL